MKNLKLSGSILAVLAVLCLGAWAVVIFVALQVSTIVLKTLDQIVQLAGMGG